MSASALIRWGAVGLMLGGVVWVILGLSALVGYLQAIPGREDVVLFVAAHLLSVVGLVGLHALQKDSYGLLGRAGFYLALAAMAARAFGAVVFLAGSSALEWISFPATLSMLVGFVLYGVATLRARVLPRWFGVASHRFAAHIATLGSVWDRAVRALPGSAGLRAVDAKGRYYRAGLTCELNFQEGILHAVP